MSAIKSIRERLGLTQEAFGDVVGCTQGNVWHYEKGQAFPTEAAKKLIAYAGTRGITITYEAIYGEAPKAAAAPIIVTPTYKGPDRRAKPKHKAKAV